MKFNPVDCKWIAIHDKKIVEYPNYIDIDRNTLKEFQLRDVDGNVVFSLKNPKKLFARLRTEFNSKGETRRVWIIGNSKPLKYFVIDGETIEEGIKWGGKYSDREVEFREDEL